MLTAKVVKACYRKTLAYFPVLQVIKKKAFYCQQLRLEGLAWGKHSSLFSQDLSDQEKSFKHRQLMSEGLCQEQTP